MGSVELMLAPSLRSQLRPNSALGCACSAPRAAVGRVGMCMFQGRVWPVFPPENAPGFLEKQQAVLFERASQFGLGQNGDFFSQIEFWAGRERGRVKGGQLATGY